jgi:APA family basic amino acid/polyamine antiporter
MNNSISLVRGLGLVAAVSIVVGDVIGQGVFLKARVMTCNVGTPGRVIAVWIVSGLLSLAGALTYAELAAMMPKAGGEYVFVREAYGKPLSFLYGWMTLFIAKSGSIAALGVGFAIFLNILAGGALDVKLFTLPIGSTSIAFGSLQIIALAAIAVVTIINCASVRIGGGVAAFFTGLKIALVLFIGLGAFLFARGDWTHYALTNTGGACAGVDAAARGGLAGFGAAMLGALWAYDGWNNVTLVAGEVKNPQRNIPIALIGGMIVVGALYVFANLAYFYVLTPTEVASVAKDSSVATEVATRFVGSTAVGLMAAGLLFSTFGTLQISTLSGARVPFAMARDGNFFPHFSRLHARTRVPVFALIVQSVWSAILALSGSYDALTDYAIFASWIFYGLVTASVFIFRRQMPDAERPYKTFGYPVVPIVFLIVTAWLLYNTLRTAPRQSFAGLGLIALGLPVYWFLARQNQNAIRAKTND